MDKVLNDLQGEIATIDKAVELCSVKYTNVEIESILKGSDDVKKCIAIMNIDEISSQSFANLFIFHLTNQGGTVREAVSIKLNDLLSRNISVDYFQTDEIVEKISNGVIDINPNNSRLIIEILNKIENKSLLLKLFDEKIRFCLSEILQSDVLQNHQINKYYFKIYWLLEALAILNDFDISQHIDLLSQIADLPEYTVREKVAILVLKNKEKDCVQNLITKLKNDTNYYVKRIFN